jgi:transcriptional regulator with XRE-family HTH domain
MPMALEEGLLARGLKALRQGKGWTQHELAAKAGVRLSVVTNIEQGVTSDPRASTLRALADALGVAVDSLVREDV